MIISVGDYRQMADDQETPPDRIESAIKYVQTMVESYIGYALELTEIDETVFVGTNGVFRLSRWPIVEIFSITYDGVERRAVDVLAGIDAQAGLVWHDGSLRNRSVVVRYAAGYAVIPRDIREAVVAIVADVIAHGRQSDARRVKRETVFGVAAVDYSEESDEYPALGAFAHVFDRYKSVAIA